MIIQESLDMIVEMDPEKIAGVRYWSSHLAFESHRDNLDYEWYVWPAAVRKILNKLSTGGGYLIAVLGLQGVGKSNALGAIQYRLARLIREDYQNKYQEMLQRGETPREPKSDPVILFKWRRETKLFESLFDHTHEAWKHYLNKYDELRGIYGSSISEKELRKQAWLKLLSEKNTILIDTQDYAKSDRRMMTKDLDEIYWLWNHLSRSYPRPNLVIAVQKELFQGHFFFDKMEKVELEPLTPEQMLEAYEKLFLSTDPFTREAVLTLARMSRGVFRRFLRYVNVTLDTSEENLKKRLPINEEDAKAAISIDRLVEDMELELMEIYPKQSDLRRHTIRLLIHLQETGQRRQSQLAEELGLEPYTLTRLLQKLELHRYIVRQRDGTDKIVSIRETQ